MRLLTCFEQDCWLLWGAPGSDFERLISPLGKERGGHVSIRLSLLQPCWSQVFNWIQFLKKQWFHSPVNYISPHSAFRSGTALVKTYLLFWNSGNESSGTVVSSYVINPWHLCYGSSFFIFSSSSACYELTRLRKEERKFRGKQILTEAP